MTSTLQPLTGPSFSSFTADQVQWLLTDYSNLDLERPVSEREPLIQAGVRHYAQDLPYEQPPDPAYNALADRLLADCAPEVALAVESAADQIRAVRPSGTVLVSFARAGVPAGIWIREALRIRHGVQAPHYAMSIVKGFGLDDKALDYLLEHEDPKHLIFVDGWTGKGSIHRELADFITGARPHYGHISGELAVLADPGNFAEIAGTSKDLLIPTATLNSTSCGLISRTILPQDTTPQQFHGAKFYRKFAPYDRSQKAIKLVVQHLDPARTSKPRDQFSAIADISALAESLDTHPEFMKPGVGEATRVLQRRIPDRIVVHPEHATSTRLDHIHALAEKRRVPILMKDTGPFACVGIVRPVSAGSM